jgi:hypothetical protein
MNKYTHTHIYISNVVNKYYFQLFFLFCFICFIIIIIIRMREILKECLIIILLSLSLIEREIQTNSLYYLVYLLKNKENFLSLSLSFSTLYSKYNNYSQLINKPG